MGGTDVGLVSYFPVFPVCGVGDGREEGGVYAHG